MISARAGGVVEVDEAYVGPKPRRMHTDKRAKCKVGLEGRGKLGVPLMGMFDRELRQGRAKVVPNVKRETLQSEILANVDKKSKIYIDNFGSYDNLRWAGQDYIHKTVDHVQECLNGQVHTQVIENFWSLLKRGLRGTYVAVEPFHLDAYVAEQVFRFNNRATKDNPLTDADRFALAVSQISGERLTYAELTGKVGETTPF